MPKYIIPIDAWVSIEAPDANTAWEQAINSLSGEIGNAIELVGNGNVIFGEPEIDDEEND